MVYLYNKYTNKKNNKKRIIFKKQVIIPKVTYLSSSRISFGYVIYWDGHHGHT